MRLILHPMEQATLRARGTVRVRCLGGTLWITGEDGADRLLEKGQAAELPAAQARHLSSVRRRDIVDMQLDLQVALQVDMQRAVPAPSGGLRGTVAAFLRQLRQFL